MNPRLGSTFLAAARSFSAQALDYPGTPCQEGKMDPQKTGWPLSAEARALVLKAEHDRRPGRASNQHHPHQQLTALQPPPLRTGSF